VNVKKYKPTATPHSRGELLAKNLERSEVNIHTAQELLVDCRRSHKRAQDVLARSQKLRELSRKLKSQGNSDSSQ